MLFRFSIFLGEFGLTVSRIFGDDKKKIVFFSGELGLKVSRISGDAKKKLQKNSRFVNRLARAHETSAQKFRVYKNKNGVDIRRLVR